MVFESKYEKCIVHTNESQQDGNETQEDGNETQEDGNETQQDGNDRENNIDELENLEENVILSGDDNTLIENNKLEEKDTFRKS